MIVRLAPHTRARAEERGASEVEIRDVLENGAVIPAKAGREARSKVYPFEATRLGKYYREKRVEVVFVRDGDEVETVTAYVFYGSWSER